MSELRHTARNNAAPGIRTQAQFVARFSPSPRTRALKIAIAESLASVRFALKADKQKIVLVSPLSARSGLMQCSKRRLRARNATWTENPRQTAHT